MNTRTSDWSKLAASVFEHSHDGILISDVDNRIVAVNRAFVELTGYSEEEVLGRDPAFLHSGRHDAEHYQQMWRGLRDEGFWQGELWDRRKNGETFLAQLSISVVRDEHGEVTHHVGICTDVSRLKETQQQLEKLAHFDSLTELPNRNLFYDRLYQALATARRQNQMLALVFLDLDGFKPVNDHHGHAMGDRLLVEVANRLREALRTGDTVARLGGDEFVLLVSQVKSMDELDPILSRLLKDVAMPYFLDGQDIRVSASMGVTVYPLDGSDPDTLMRHADQAMYQAKQGGRNRYHLFDAEQDRLAQTRREQVARVRETIARDELVLYYQPKVNMRTGRIVGLEALLRWRHPERGILQPQDCLPLVENSDFIVEIGQWVIEQTLAQMLAWQAEGLDLEVSVNIAARHLQRLDFTDRLKAVLARYPSIPPDRLELEILESAALDNMDRVRETILACQVLGVRFALDDFGTGYSSLSHLRHIPSDTLKIDCGFVRGILDDVDDLTLVESVIGLGAAFVRQVIAEGVETPEHGVVLMRLGCDVAQGYGIAHPLPAEQVPGWVANWQPDPQWSLWADTHWEMADFPLLVAQYDHLKWVRRVLMTASGGVLQLTPAELTDHHQCRFGHWYYGHGWRRYSELAEFQAIEPVHMEVHEVGPEIVRLKNAGDTEMIRLKVEQLLGLKDCILDHLQRLQKAVAREAVEKGRV